MTSKHQSTTSHQPSRQRQKQSAPSRVSNQHRQNVMSRQGFSSVIQKANDEQNLSHLEVALLQDAIGNSAVGKVLQQSQGVQTKVANSQQSSSSVVGVVQRGLFDDAVSWIGNKVEKGADWAGGKVDSAADWAGGKADSAAGWVGDKADSAADWVGAKANTGGEWAKEQIDSARQALENVAEWVAEKV